MYDSIKKKQKTKLTFTHPLDQNFQMYKRQ